jgi:hypothetical protein
MKGATFSLELPMPPPDSKERPRDTDLTVSRMESLLEPSLEQATGGRADKKSRSASHGTAFYA